MKKFISLFLTIILLLGATALIGCGGTGGDNPPSGTFTVVFNGNGGIQVDGDAVSLIQTVSSADQIIPPTFERQGYYFSGWDKDLSAINGDTVVKAQWLKDDSIEQSEFKVVFDGNGGVQAQGDTVSLEQMVSSADQILEPTFEREGYIFVGWNLDISTIDGNAVVQATWVKDYKEFVIRLSNEYYHDSRNRTITYTIKGQTIFSVPKGELITTLNLETPTISQKDSDDFAFSYWAYKDSDGKYVNIKDVLATYEIAVDGVITLYPKTRSLWIGPY